MDVREKYIEAGKIASEALHHGAKLIKIDASLLYVTEKVEKKVLDMGGEFAFPPQISLNEIAAHSCADPNDTLKFKKGDLAKIDVGVMIDGYIGDNALTIDLGDNENLVKASRDALNNALKIIEPSVTLGEIGKTIQETITKLGFAPVRNLSGHGLAQYIYHDKPSIPSNGAGIIFESSSPNIFSLTNKKPVRNIITRNVLKEIEKYKGMPFTTRWLVKKIPEFKVKFAIRELLQQRIITGYPPLPDRDGGFISQAEHTVIVEKDPIITTKN